MIDILLFFRENKTAFHVNRLLSRRFTGNVESYFFLKNKETNQSVGDKRFKVVHIKKTKAQLHITTKKRDKVTLTVI